MIEYWKRDGFLSGSTICPEAQCWIYYAWPVDQTFFFFLFGRYVQRQIWYVWSVTSYLPQFAADYLLATILLLSPIRHIFSSFSYIKKSCTSFGAFMQQQHTKSIWEQLNHGQCSVKSRQPRPSQATLMRITLFSNPDTPATNISRQTIDVLARFEERLLEIDSLLAGSWKARWCVLKWVAN